MDLTPDRYEALEALFQAVRRIELGEREALLSAADPDLAVRARELLGAEAGALFSEDEIAQRREHVETLATATPDIPEHVGPYRIVRCIGEGGMGVVFEAIQAKPERRVALKVLNSGVASQERIKRFEREAEWLGRLHHPGIAQVFEAGHFDFGHGDQPFLAMEFIDGVDILTSAARRGLSVRDRLKLLAQVCEAVHHAHDTGVLHRDLKPDNVLVDPHGVPKLLDFGISRGLDAEETIAGTLTAEGQILGTLGYMAPEQLDPEPGTLGPGVDVYALGVIGFELLTGRRPINTAGMGLTETLRTLSSTEPTVPSAVVPALRGDVDTMIGKAMERDPARRYASAAALASDLWRSMDNLPIRARPPSRSYRLAKFVRRNRGAAALLGSLALGLLGTIGFAVDARTKGHAARKAQGAESAARRELVKTLYAAESRLAFAAASQPQGLGIIEAHVEEWRGRPTGDVEPGFEFELLEAIVDETPERFPGTALQEVLATRPDLGISAIGSGGVIEIREIAGGASIWTAGRLDGRALDIDLSPDGNEVVAAEIMGVVSAWERGRPDRKWAADISGKGPCAVAWCQGAGLVLCGDFAGGIHALDAATGARLWTIDELRVSMPNCLAVAPDGRRCALATESSIVVLALSREGGEVIATLPDNGQPTVLDWSSDGRRLAFGGREGAVGVWSLAEERLDFLTQAHTAVVVQVEFNPSDRLLVSAGWDRTAHVCDSVRGRFVRRLRPGGQVVRCAAFMGESTVAVGIDEQGPAIWDLNVPGPVSEGWLMDWRTAQAETQLLRRPDGRGFDGICGEQLFTIDPRVALPRMGGSPIGASAVARCARTGQVAILNGEELVIATEDADGKRTPILELPLAPEGVRIHRMQWSPAGQRRLAIVGPMTLQVLDMEGTPELRTLQEFFDCYPSVQWTADGQWLLLGSSPKVLRRVSPADGQVHGILETGDTAQALALSPDGETLAVGTASNALLLVDPMTLEIRTKLSGHTGEILGLAWHPNGRRLASGGYDRVLRIWDTQRAELVAALDSGHQIGSLGWSADGRQLLALTRQAGLVCWAVGGP